MVLCRLPEDANRFFSRSVVSSQLAFMEIVLGANVFSMSCRARSIASETRFSKVFSLTRRPVFGSRKQASHVSLVYFFKEKPTVVSPMLCECGQAFMAH